MWTELIISFIFIIAAERSSCRNSISRSEFLQILSNANISIGRNASGSNHRCFNVFLIVNHFHNDSRPEKSSEDPEKVQLQSFELNQSAQSLNSDESDIYNASQCPEDYYPENGGCYQIPQDFEVPVKSAQACEYLKEAYYAEGKCYSFRRNLHKPCNTNNECHILFSKCSNGTCQCTDNYLEHDQRCYGRPNAECSTPQDCPTMWLSCSVGTCQNSFTQNGTKLVSSKSGATVRFEPVPHISYKRVAYNYTNMQGEVRPMTGVLRWSNDHSLDRVALPLDIDESFGSTQPLVVVWCRVNVKNINNKFLMGRITIPGDGLCRFYTNGTVVATADYQLLKDFGE